MWQRFTERSRKVIFYAQEEAQRFGEGNVSTEHILLGLLREDDSVALRVLAAIGVSVLNIRTEVERRLSQGDSRPSQDMTLTPRAKRVIDLAYDEARNLNNDYIGTEHLLLGLVREEDGIAARVLTELGADLEATRRGVLDIQAAEGRVVSVPSPPKSDLRGRQSPLLSAAMLAVRQRRIGADLMSLLLLSEAPNALLAQLKELGLTDAALMTAIETEILIEAVEDRPAQSPLGSIWKEGSVDAGRLFGMIATSPDTFTHRALIKLSISPDDVRRVFGLQE